MTKLLTQKVLDPDDIRGLKDVITSHEDVLSKLLNEAGLLTGPIHDTVCEMQRLTTRLEDLACAVEKHRKDRALCT